jgi:hypothetical protein
MASWSSWWHRSASCCSVAPLLPLPRESWLGTCRQPISKASACPACRCSKLDPPRKAKFSLPCLQGCPQLRSLHCLNVTNNHAINRLVRINDAFLVVLAKSCPQLQELHLGESCLY